MAASSWIRSRAAAVFTAAILTLLTSGLQGSAAGAEAPFTVFYKGRESLVLDRLKLDPATRIVGDMAHAQCVVMQDTLPLPGPQLEKIKSWVSQGKGLVVILGHQVDPKALEALTNGDVKQVSFLEAAPGPYHAAETERIAGVIEYTGPPRDRLQEDIHWKSAVRVFARSILEVKGGHVLVATSAKDPVRPRTPILVRLEMGKGVIYVLNVWLREGNQADRVRSYIKLLSGVHEAHNYDFQRWSYFNWLLYDLTRSSAGVRPVAFGVWPESPVPHGPDITVLSLIFLSLSLVLVLSFAVTRRYSMKHPESLQRFYLRRPRPASLGAAAPGAVEWDAAATATHGDPRWEIVGFHRPLSGFLYNYMLALLVMIPFNFVFSFYIDRNFINPFLEARGAWAAVAQFMGFFFALLDLGTGQAMVKYFAEFRVKDPPRAITYAQFFIWFHALGGVAEITVLGLVAAVWMPETSVAFLTWYVILHTWMQFPGFIAIFSNLFRALQRFDYAQILIVLTFVLTPLIQMVTAIYGRHWGLMHPVFGEGMGVVFGFALGGVLANIVLGVFCAIFYHKVGFRLATIFLAHFDADTVKRSLVYGVKLTGGNLLSAASWGLLPFIMLALIPNFFELNEIWMLAFTLTYPYIETGAYIFAVLMPSISESYSHSMMLLTQRYLDQGLRWGIIITSMLAGAFIAFSDIFIQGLLPPQFLRAVEVMMLMHVWRLFDFSTRLPDQVFQGVGHTGLFTLTVAVEHLSRIVLSWLFISRFGFIGIFYAFILSSLAKSLVAWPAMARRVLPLAISVWQTLVNPTLAAIGNYFVLKTLADAIWRGPGHTASAWLVVLVCLFGSLPVYMLLSGLLGWDRTALSEFRDAAELVPAPFGVAARAAHWLVEFGCALSPFHDRFPTRRAKGAAAEALELTASKIAMH